MKADYYLGQAELATELKGLIETLKYDLELKDQNLMEVVSVFLDNKERVTKEVYFAHLPKSVRQKLLVKQI